MITAACGPTPGSQTADPASFRRVDAVYFGAPPARGGPPGGAGQVQPSPNQRADLASWRAALESARDVQIRRLATYRERGVFPTYLGPDGTTHIAHRTLSRQEPVFVDDNGVHCAVGFLMSRSGWDDAVDMIAGSDNHVLIEDVSSGPLTDWILRSGLTAEEAAMIQPSYKWRPAPRPRPPDEDREPDPLPDPMIAEHRRLTNHFIAVEEKLRLETDVSIERALERLLPHIEAGLSLDAVGGPER